MTIKELSLTFIGSLGSAKSTFTQVIAPYGNKRSRNPYFTSVNAPYFTPVKITTLSLKGLAGQSVVFAIKIQEPMQ